MTLPLVPNDVPGSPAPDPLITPQQYFAQTKDTGSSVADVEQALADAIEVACNECRRTLLYGNYTEVQFLYDNGMVFPSATPIDPTKPISSGVSEKIYDPATDNNPGSIIQGQGVWVGWFTPLPWMPVFTGVLPAQTTVDYWGGFTQLTLPSRLRKAIITMAFYYLTSVGLPSMVGGIKSESVGGVSISGDTLYSFAQDDPQTRRILRRFRHPQVRAWQS